MTWILAYDIADPKRWRRLYRLASEVGVRLQWSVFLVTQEPFDTTAFLREAASVIDPRADDVRLYRVTGTITGNFTRAPQGEPIEGVIWRGLPGPTARRLRAAVNNPAEDG